MATETQQLIATSLVKILRPLIRILLRNGVTYRAFTETAKTVYVEVAAAEFGIPGRKQTDSRISVITGLSRKEVKRVKSLPGSGEGNDLARYNRASRVISGWTQDADFMDARGNPQDLPLDDADNSFAELVRRYSGDAPPRAVLDELEQVGAVQRLESGALCLVTRGYIPQTDSPERLGIFGVMAADLLSSSNHNLQDTTGKPYFQRIVANERIPAPATDEFQQVTRRYCQQFLEKLDQWLAENEITGDAADDTELKRIGVGIYYFEESDADR
jgi:hypothetical protein